MASRCWNKLLNNFLLKIGFIQSLADNYAFVGNFNGTNYYIVFVILYADDALIMYPSNTM